MAENMQNGLPQPVLPRVSFLVGAVQVAHDTPVRQSANGVHFATYGETGVADLDLDRMLETVPTAITAGLKANTYYFVPLALREANEHLELAPGQTPAAQEPAMVASAYTEEFSDAAICHRNVELGHGKRAVFISTRLLGDRFALSFEFFINVAHAFTDQAEIPPCFSELVWQQALAGVRGETSIDAWEARNLAFGRPVNAQPEPVQPASRRNRWAIARFSARQRSFNATNAATPGTFSQIHAGAGQTVVETQPAIDEKERALYLETAFSDAVAIYLLSLALDFDYNELREREYPLLAPGALAARLNVIAELFPPNAGYEFAVRYRRRA